MKFFSLYLAIFLFASCQSTYYKAWEFLGKEKRDLLVSKIDSTKTAQEDSKKEIRDILEEVRNRYGLNANEVESFYDRLKNDYEKFNKQAESLKSKASDVRTIANDLFEEWAAEANTFKNSSYKRQSLQKLQETKAKFSTLSSRMKVSENQLDQVVGSLRDQVLFLKHNLNAKTIAPFDREFHKIEGEIQKLILKIDKSLSATQDFQLTLK